MCEPGSNLRGQCPLRSRISSLNCIFKPMTNQDSCQYDSPVAVRELRQTPRKPMTYDTLIAASNGERQISSPKVLGASWPCPNQASAPLKKKCCCKVGPAASARGVLPRHLGVEKASAHDRLFLFREGACVQRIWTWHSPHTACTLHAFILNQSRCQPVEHVDCKHNEVDRRKLGIEVIAMRCRRIAVHCMTAAREMTVR